VAEETFTFGAATNPDQADTPFMLGVRWSSAVAGQSAAVEWLRPTNLPTIDVYCALYRASDQQLVASGGPFAPNTLTAGLNRLNFTAAAAIEPTETYVSAVLTNRYAFSVPGGWPFTTASMTAPLSGNGRLASTSAGTLVYPGTAHVNNANFHVSPVFEAGEEPPQPPPEPVLLTTALTAAGIVTGIGECILDELENTPESGGVTDKMRRCLLVPGAIAWDACDCGQLALSIQRSYPSTTFPTEASEDPARGGCPPGLQAYDVLASLTRCVPGVDARGNPPSCDALLAAALRLEGDAFALRRGVVCCLVTYKRERRIMDWRAGAVNRVGPEGNCAGVELTFKFLISAG
jgi:hypothetical protein